MSDSTQHTPAKYRRNITKSRSGHYHLTVIEVATGHRQTGRFGWGTAERATAEEYAWCTAQLEERAALRRSLSADMHKVCLAVAKVTGGAAS